MARLSPLHIRIAIEFATSGAPGANIPSNIWNSPAADGVKNWLVEQELVRDGEPTEKLHAWIEFICETPLPVQKWLRPHDTGDSK